MRINEWMNYTRSHPISSFSHLPDPLISLSELVLSQSPSQSVLVPSVADSDEALVDRPDPLPAIDHVNQILEGRLAHLQIHFFL